MIKKLFTALLGLGLANGALAQNPITITGELHTDRIVPVHLFSVKNGVAVQLAEQQPSATGKFGFNFYPDYEGLYLIGTGNGMSQTDVSKFWFKGGDRLAVSISDSSYVLMGKDNTKENLLLTQWHDAVYPIEKKAVYFMKGNSTYVDFFPQLEAFNQRSATFLAGKTTGNTRFDDEMKNIIRLDIAAYACNFLQTPRSAHPALEEFSPYFNALNIADLTRTSALLYNYPFGMRLMRELISVESRKKGIKWAKEASYVKTVTDMIPNDTLKGEFVLQSVASLKTNLAYKAIMDTVGQYIITADQKSRNVAIATPLASLKTGEEGFKFTYPDQNGKQVSLDDLKGKVVLVDMWATWCGPCRQEIPYMKKLAETMKGKDVAFVSISVDKEKDKAKWKQMLADEQMGGYQLFATDQNDFSKYYKVNTIPRFLVFDKKGRIVSADAPRPSEPELKAMLEKSLAN